MQTDTVSVPANGAAEFYLPEAVYFLLIDCGAAEQVDVELHRKGGHIERANNMPPGYQSRVRPGRPADYTFSKVKFYNQTASAVDVEFGHSSDLAEIDKLNIDVSGAIKLGANADLGINATDTITTTASIVLAAEATRAVGSSIQNHGPADVWLRYLIDPNPGSQVGFVLKPGEIFQVTAQSNLRAVTASGTAVIFISEELTS